MKKLIVIVLLFVMGCQINPPEKSWPAQPTSKPLRIHVRRDGSIVEQDRVRRSKWWNVAELLKRAHPEWPQSVAEIAGELEYQEYLNKQEKGKK